MSHHDVKFLFPNMYIIFIYFKTLLQIQDHLIQSLGARGCLFKYIITLNTVIPTSKSGFEFLGYKIACSYSHQGA